MATVLWIAPENATRLERCSSLDIKDSAKTLLRKAPQKHLLMFIPTKERSVWERKCTAAAHCLLFLGKESTPQKLIIHFEGEDAHLKTQKSPPLMKLSRTIQTFTSAKPLYSAKFTILNNLLTTEACNTTMQKQYHKLWLHNGENWTRTHPLRHSTTSICYCATRVVTCLLCMYSIYGHPSAINATVHAPAVN